MSVEDIAEITHQTADDLLDVPQIVDRIEIGFLLLGSLNERQQLL